MVPLTYFLGIHFYTYVLVTAYLFFIVYNFTISKRWYKLEEEFVTDMLELLSYLTPEDFTPAKHLYFLMPKNIDFVRNSGRTDLVSIVRSSPKEKHVSVKNASIDNDRLYLNFKFKVYAKKYSKFGFPYSYHHTLATLGNPAVKVKPRNDGSVVVNMSVYLGKFKPHLFYASRMYLLKQLNALIKDMPITISLI